MWMKAEMKLAGDIPVTVYADVSQRQCMDPQWDETIELVVDNRVTGEVSLRTEQLEIFLMMCPVAEHLPK